MVADECMLGNSGIVCLVSWPLPQNAMYKRVQKRGNLDRNVCIPLPWHGQPAPHVPEEALRSLKVLSMLQHEGVYSPVQACWLHITAHGVFSAPRVTCKDLSSSDFQCMTGAAGNSGSNSAGAQVDKEQYIRAVHLVT